MFFNCSCICVAKRKINRKVKKKKRLRWSTGFLASCDFFFFSVSSLFLFLFLLDRSCFFFWTRKPCDGLYFASCEKNKYDLGFDLASFGSGYHEICESERMRSPLFLQIKPPSFATCYSVLIRSFRWDASVSLLLWFAFQDQKNNNSCVWNLFINRLEYMIRVAAASRYCKKVLPFA